MENTIGKQPGTTGIASTESGSSVREKVQDKAHEVKEQLSAKTRDTTQRIKSEGEYMLRDQKNRMAECIDHCGSAVHRAAEKLEEDQDAAIALYTHRAAEQLERAADYIRGHDWRDLRRDAENFARRHQEFFYGSLLLGGIILARFLKASSSRDRGHYQQYQSGHYEGSQSSHYETPQTSAYASDPARPTPLPGSPSSLPTTANL